MNFKQIHSGSSGNMYLVTANNGKRLIIDPGVSWAKVQNGLDYRMHNIVGCLLSHSHGDHAKSVDQIMKAGIEVYSSKETFDALGIHGRRSNAIKERCLIRLNGIDVLSFYTQHDDTPGSMGFIIKADGQFLLFATDTRSLPKFKHQFSIICIECNYDPEIMSKRVDDGELTRCVAERTMMNHMGKGTLVTYLKDFCNLDICTEIHLLHMSSENIDKEATAKEIYEKFFIKVVTA